MSHTADFLHQHSDPVHKPTGRPVWPFVLMGVLGLVVLYLIVAALGAGRVLAASLDAKDEIRFAQESAAALEFESARAALDRAADDIDRAQGGFIWLKPLTLLPFLGDQVSAVEQVLSASEELIPALTDAIAIAEEVVSVVDRAREIGTIDVDAEVSYLTMPADLRRDLLKKLHQSLPEFERIRARIAIAEQDVLALNELHLVGPIAEAIEPFRILLPELAQTMDLLIPVSALLPELAGTEDPSRFLLLFQNNAELRPGGGFIGTIGELTMNNGLIQTLTSEDVYNIDGLVEGRVTTAAPPPFPKYLGVNNWYLRDANWSPDFAVSARKTIELYDAERALIDQPATTYDGVIGFTPTYASALLKIVGPITIEDQTFTAENIIDTLEYQVELGFLESGLPRSQRKDVVGHLMAEVVARLLSMPLSNWPTLIEATLTAQSEKQLLVMMIDSESQAIVEKAGWGGTLHPNELDTLLVVDANLASLKTDPVVDRQISYRVRQNDEGRLVANVEITYTHTGNFDWKTTRYRTYTRVYVPLGSELIRTQGLLANDKLKNPSLAAGTPDVFTDLGYTVFAGFTSIEPGEIGTISFSYYLPDKIAEMVTSGRYGLDIIKQPGAANHDLTVDVDFGTPIVSASPAEDVSQYGDTRYLLNTILDHNKGVVVRF